MHKVCYVHCSQTAQLKLLEHNFFHHAIVQIIEIYWLCPHNMRSRVYETVCPSVCLSVQSIDSSSGVWVCCWAPGRPGGQEISIDCCMARWQQAPALSSNGTTARRLAANAGSVKLTADVGSWTETCLNRYMGPSLAARHDVVTRILRSECFFVIACKNPGWPQPHSFSFLFVAYLRRIIARCMMGDGCAVLVMFCRRRGLLQSLRWNDKPRRVQYGTATVNVARYADCPSYCCCTGRTHSTWGPV